MLRKVQDRAMVTSEHTTYRTMSFSITLNDL